MRSRANHMLGHRLLQGAEQHILKLIRLTGHMSREARHSRWCNGRTASNISAVTVDRHPLAVVVLQDAKAQQNDRHLKPAQKITDLSNPVKAQLLGHNFETGVLMALQQAHQVAHEMHIGKIHLGVQIDQFRRWGQDPIIAPGMNAIEVIRLAQDARGLKNAKLCPVQQREQPRIAAERVQPAEQDCPDSDTAGPACLRESPQRGVRQTAHRSHPRQRRPCRPYPTTVPARGTKDAILRIGIRHARPPPSLFDDSS